ncbi:hypothetical protein EVU87_22125, partial [Salmonella enterica subsp. enterica serovar Anatum]|nr:hypothetical protein [Salmonella enterica subsp. enterica serovar Anatum]
PQEEQIAVLTASTAGEQIAVLLPGAVPEQTAVLLPPSRTGTNRRSPASEPCRNKPPFSSLRAVPEQTAVLLRLRITISYQVELEIAVNYSLD